MKHHTIFHRCITQSFTTIPWHIRLISPIIAQLFHTFCIHCFRADPTLQTKHARWPSDHQTIRPSQRLRASGVGLTECAIPSKCKLALAAIASARALIGGTFGPLTFSYGALTEQSYIRYCLLCVCVHRKWPIYNKRQCVTAIRVYHSFTHIRPNMARTLARRTWHARSHAEREDSQTADGRWLRVSVAGCVEWNLLYWRWLYRLVQQGTIHMFRLFVAIVNAQNIASTFLQQTVFEPTCFCRLYKCCKYIIDKNVEPIPCSNNDTEMTSIYIVCMFQ